MLSLKNAAQRALSVQKISEDSRKIEMDPYQEFLFQKKNSRNTDIKQILSESKNRRYLSQSYESIGIQSTNGFKTSRLLRYSSNEADTSPTFIDNLIKYNRTSHHDFNPRLLSKASRKAYEDVLGLQIKKDEYEFDRRFMVKPPFRESKVNFSQKT